MMMPFVWPNSMFGQVLSIKILVYKDAQKRFLGDRCDRVLECDPRSKTRSLYPVTDVVECKLGGA